MGCYMRQLIYYYQLSNEATYVRSWSSAKWERVAQMCKCGIGLVATVLYRADCTISHLDRVTHNLIR